MLEGHAHCRYHRAKPWGHLLPTPLKVLTSLLQSWKTSLVRILQEESTIVCFMRLLWQVAGDESRGTWEPGKRQASHQLVRLGFTEPRRSQETLLLTLQPPEGHTAHKPLPAPMRMGTGGHSRKQALGFCPHKRPRRTFLVSAHCELTFQEFPKSTGSSST